MGIFSGLEKLGLDMEKMDVYDQAEEKQKEGENKQGTHQLTEEDVIFDKNYKCPVCDHEFKSKAIKTGKVKMLSADTDLRPKYQTVDCIKYDSIVCDKCGYAALSRYFSNITMAQAKLIKQNISPNFKGITQESPIYSYDDAILRYQLVLANAVVKKAKVSERAYICLKLAWVIRGKYENLDFTKPDYEEEKASLMKEEQKLIQNAYEGFKTAMGQELFPICGMDQYTYMYVTADLARRCKDYQISLKILSEIITSRGANSKLKDRARDIKDLIKDEKKG